MLPSDAAAWIRPTTRPPSSTAWSESRVSTGVAAPRIVDGRKKRSAFSQSTWRIAGAPLGSSSDVDVVDEPEDRAATRASAAT